MLPQQESVEFDNRQDDNEMNSDTEIERHTSFKMLAEPALEQDSEPMTATFGSQN